MKSLSVSAVSGEASLFDVDVSDMQSNIAISGSKVTGTLKYLSGSNAITDVWGEGNFICLAFTSDDWSKYTSVKVGLEPSQSSGLVELINDPDKNGVFKVGNDVSQKFKIVMTDGTHTKTQVLDLSGLVLEEAGEG